MKANNKIKAHYVESGMLTHVILLLSLPQVQIGFHRYHLLFP